MVCDHLPGQFLIAEGQNRTIAHVRRGAARDGDEPVFPGRDVVLEYATVFAVDYLDKQKRVLLLRLPAQHVYGRGCRQGYAGRSAAIDEDRGSGRIAHSDRVDTTRAQL